MPCDLIREILNDIPQEQPREAQNLEIVEPRTETAPVIRHGHSKTENSAQNFQRAISETVSFHNTAKNSQLQNDIQSVSKEEVILKENEVGSADNILAG